jgi:outer membrane murein-binding lipoprotein Lpp
VTVIGKRSPGVALAVLLLAGCGHTAGGGSKPALSHSEFVAQANQVCRDASTRTARIAGLSHIRPPAAAKDLYDHWLNAEREALAAAKELDHPTEKAKGDPLVPLTIAEGKIDGYARRLGADACEEPQAGTIPP